MALIGSIAINMKVQTASLKKGLDASSKMLHGFSASVVQTGASLQKLFAAGALYETGKGLTHLVKSASDLTEATSYLNQVFGSSAADIIAESDRMALAFGTSRVEFLSSASALGDMFTNMGYAKDQAAVLSTAMVKLAGDISSAKNIRFDEALTKLQAGLAGEAEPLRRFGVDLTEVALKSQAAKMGIKAMNGEFTAAEKTQIRLAIIMNQTKSSQGDLAKTADGVANSMRGLGGRIEYLAEVIGAVLEPIAAAVLGEMNTAVTALSLYWEDNKNSVVAWGQTAVGAVGETSKSMGWLQKSIGFVADAFQVMKLGFYAAQSYITAGVSTIIKSFSGLGHALDFIVEKLSGYKAGIGDFIDTYGADLDRLSGEQWKKFQTELAKPPASQGINEYFDKAAQKIKAVRKEAAKAGPDITGMKPSAATAAMTKAEAPKFASAAAMGSKEAANAILRSRYGAGVGKGPQEQTAQNTKKMVQLLEKIAVASGGSGIQAGANVGALAFAGNF